MAISKRRAAQSTARRNGSAHFPTPSQADIPVASDREWTSSILLRNYGEEAGPAGKRRHTGKEELRGVTTENRKQ